MGTAPRRAARHRGRAHARGRRPRPLLLARTPARRHGNAPRPASSTHRRCSSSMTCTGWTTRRRSSLRYLGTQLPTRPWLACTTRRPGEDGFAAATGTPPLPALTLRLEPLPEDDARALAVAAAGDRRLTDDEVAALMERAAGNPLFLQRLASVGDKTDEAEELPETVEALVATRIDQLGPGDRALLRWASVLGVSFSGSLIADVLEDDAERRRSDPRRGNDSASTSSGIRTSLARSGSVTRSSATPRTKGSRSKRRRELHARVAEVIERTQGARAEDVRRDPRAPLPPRGALARDVALLDRSRPPGSGEVRERRSGAVSRAGAGRCEAGPRCSQPRSSRGQRRHWATSACSSAGTRRHVRRCRHSGEAHARATPSSTPALPKSATGCRYGSASPPKRCAG